MTLERELDLNEKLESYGWVDKSRQPGVYSLKLVTPPDDWKSLEGTWHSYFGAPPPDGLLDRLAEADRLLYVGSHGKSMYERMAQHVRGFKTSTITQIWKPVDVVGVWPEDDPDAEEWNRAVALSDERTACWCNGEWL